VTEKRFFPASVIDEAAHLAEEAAHTSATYGWFLTLAGELSSETIQEALDACLDYYPKFRCILAKDYPSVKRWYRYCWKYQDVKGKDIFKEIDNPEADNDPEGIRYYIKHHPSFCIDITRHVPVRAFIIRKPGGANLILLFHHAAVDGLGSVFFIQKFVESCEDIFHQRRKDRPAADLRAVSFPEISPPWKGFSFRRFRNLRSRRTLFQERPWARVCEQEIEGPTGEYLAVTRKISPDQFQLVRASAKEYQASINDYLLVALFQTVKKWNGQQGREQESICVNAPRNLRPPGDHTAGNIFTVFNIALGPESIGDKRETLRLIREEQAFMTENDAAKTKEQMIWLLNILPLELKRRVFARGAGSRGPSISLTNLGVFSPNPSRKDKEGLHYIGPARLRSMTGIGPALPWPMVSVMTYNGEVRIGMSTSRTCFSPEAAERFIDSFVQETMG
jgi:NRPS condensation-like uncharacterized protein